MTSTCYQCERETAYLFADSRCCDCTRLTVQEVTGEPSGFEQDSDEDDESNIAHPEYFAEPKTVYWGNSYATSVAFPKEGTEPTSFKSVTCSSCNKNFGSVQDFYKTQLHEVGCQNIR